jgi:hypothetical protein
MRHQAGTWSRGRCHGFISPLSPPFVEGTRAFLWFPLLVLAALLWPACRGDECSDGEAECQGNAAANCGFAYSDGGAPRVWHRRECNTDVCVVAGGSGVYARTAVCALASTRDPRCASLPQGFCDGNNVIHCTDGFAVPEYYFKGCGGTGLDAGPGPCEFGPCPARCVSDANGPRCSA